MQIRKFNRRFGSAARHGIAPLEFVMALPVLLLLMVGITWLGFSVIGQTEVIVEARNQAWKRRFENLSDKPLIFPLEITIPLMPEYSQDSDFATESASKQIKVSPVFDGLPGPESSHTVLAGSWDWRAMPFTDPPNWDLIGISVVNGTAGKFDRLADLDGDLVAEALKKVAKEKLKEFIREAAKDKPELQVALVAVEKLFDEDADLEGVGEAIMKQVLENAAKQNKAVEMILDAAGLLDDDGGSTKSKVDNTANAQNAKNQVQNDRNAKHADELAAVVAEINATQAEIDKLNNELNPPQGKPQPPADNPQPPVGEEQQKAEQDRKQQQLEFFQDKLKRLNSKKSDIERGPDLNDPNNE